MTVIVVSHETGFALRAADRVTFIDGASLLRPEVPNR